MFNILEKIILFQSFFLLMEKKSTGFMDYIRNKSKMVPKCKTFYFMVFERAAHK